MHWHHVKNCFTLLFLNTLTYANSITIYLRNSTNTAAIFEYQYQNNPCLTTPNVIFFSTTVTTEMINDFYKA